MSTKGTIAGIDLADEIGGETFHSFIHVYEECFDEPPGPVHIQIWEQGIRTNHEMSLTVPADKFRAFARALGKWAASRDKCEAAQAAKGD